MSTLTFHISAGESYYSGYLLVDEIIPNDDTGLRVRDNNECLREKNIQEMHLCRLRGCCDNVVTTLSHLHSIWNNFESETIIHSRHSMETICGIRNHP